MGKRKQHSPEFKLDAINLVLEQGYSRAEAARSLGVSAVQLGRWVKEYQDDEISNLHYIVVTLEDLPSGTHALLFSFPTSDASLVARYRHGENLQAEEVVQEASH